MSNEADDPLDVIPVLAWWVRGGLLAIAAGLVMVFALLFTSTLTRPMASRLCVRRLTGSSACRPVLSRNGQDCPARHVA